jgi:hypothetical protein
MANFAHNLLRAAGLSDTCQDDYFQPLHLLSSPSVVPEPVKPMSAPSS